MITVEECIKVLDDRAAPYGGCAGDLLDLTPVQLWDSPTELMTYWKSKDLSHVYPQSWYPEMSDDWGNIIAEDSDVNRARGAQIMTPQEKSIALADNELDADIIDSNYDDDSSEFLEELLELVEYCA